MSFNKNHSHGKDVPRLTKREANATPPEFKVALLDLARSVYRAREAA